jgi:2-polyprenyl-3-methyl-5-hydroxy-6-metoxy-1,4-benzoquinol methylase
MIDLPPPDIYEQELIYIPYKKSLEKVLSIVSARTPVNGTVLDLMCGPGYLLSQIADVRSDLSLTGVDLDEDYIDYARRNHSGINFQVGDVLHWNPLQQFDVVLCTGSIHHVPYEKQANAIAAISKHTTPEGLSIISDCYINDYSNENERKQAAAKLGFEYLIETIKNGAPTEVIAATADILHNDVMMNEFKTSVKKRFNAFEQYFSNVQIFKTWPEHDSQYGDYIMVCRK